MAHKQYCVVSGVLFCLVALAHIMRVAGGVSVVVEGIAIPMYVSWFAIIVPAALAIWAFRIARE